MNVLKACEIESVSGGDINDWLWDIVFNPPPDDTCIPDPFDPCDPPAPEPTDPNK